MPEKETSAITLFPSRLEPAAALDVFEDDQIARPDHLPLGFVEKVDNLFYDLEFFSAISEHLFHEITAFIASLLA